MGQKCRRQRRGGAGCAPRKRGRNGTHHSSRTTTSRRRTFRSGSRDDEKVGGFEGSADWSSEKDIFLERTRSPSTRERRRSENRRGERTATRSSFHLELYLSSVGAGAAAFELVGVGVSDLVEVGETINTGAEGVGAPLEGEQVVFLLLGARLARRAWSGASCTKDDDEEVSSLAAR